MSKVIGIICEYNPFHKGHKYQIDQIRQKYPDATIVAIMSGNIVQRGEFALLSKYDRAQIALECGINAVFELPYPYSGSCAEIFANAGVTLAGALGCDSICFGLEKLSIDELEKIAKVMEIDEFKNTVKAFLQDKSNSFIAAKEKALFELGYDAPKYANDMLGLEYIRAINKLGMPLEYDAIMRMGAFYNDKSFGDIMSASAIRSHFFETKEMVSVPAEAETFYEEIINKGKYVSMEIICRFLHSYCLIDFNQNKRVFDTSPEMIALIKKLAQKSSCSNEFIAKLSSKAFTTARLKRAILYNLFDIESVDFSPEYTILLGMDKKGQELLNKIRKSCKVKVITKHSDGKDMSDGTRKIFEKLYAVDAFYNTMLFSQSLPNEAYKKKPIIKK